MSEFRHLNHAAVRTHALKCSQVNRAGKFTRVGEDFIEEVEIDVERMLREPRAKFATMHPSVEATNNFVTGDFMAAFRNEIDAAVARLIQNKVQRQPSVGCTLGRTR